MKELRGMVPISHPLKRDREKVDRELEKLLRFDGVPSGLIVHLAVWDAVASGGKRIRPILALRIARHLGSEGQVCLRAAAAVELLHCASLIFDDLPCMDNTPARRGLPALHVTYGEAVALLAGVALISLSGRALMAPLPEWDPSEKKILLFQEQLLSVLDCTEMVGGQEMDLRLAASAPRAARLAVTERKTVPLFRLAVLAGCLDASPDETLLEHLIAFGAAFGRLYQSLDDCMDGCLTEPQELIEEWRELQVRSGRLFGGSESLDELVDSLRPPTGTASCTPKVSRCS